MLYFTYLHYILVDSHWRWWLQNALKNMENECAHLQLMYQSSQEELEQLIERSDEHVQEIRELNDKFQVHTPLSVLCHAVQLGPYQCLS